jgi:hypothetical protein
MKKILILIVLSVVMGLTGKAQQSDIINLVPEVPINEQLHDTVQYVFPRFREGIVYTKSSGQVKTLLNYSILMNDMLFKEGKNGIMSIGNPEDILHVDIDKSTFVYIDKQYYELIKAGNVSLLKTYRIEIVPWGRETVFGLKTQTNNVEKINVCYQAGISFKVNAAQDVKVTRKCNYYLHADGRVIKITDKKAFMKAFKKKSKEVEAYLSKAKIDFNKESDLLLALKECSSL